MGATPVHLSSVEGRFGRYIKENFGPLLAAITALVSR